MWLAASTSGPEVLGPLSGLHQALKARFANLLTVIALKEVSQAAQVVRALSARGFQVLLWSQLNKVIGATSMKLGCPQAVHELGSPCRGCTHHTLHPLHQCCLVAIAFSTTAACTPGTPKAMIPTVLLYPLTKNNCC